MSSPNAALQPSWRKIVNAQVVTADAASPEFDIPNDIRDVVIVLQAAAVTGTGPHMAATLQDTPDNGTTWIGTGNNTADLTAAGIRRLKFRRNMEFTAGVEATGATAGSTATGAASNGPVGRKCRLWFAVTGTTPNYTLNAWLLVQPEAMG